MALGAGPARHGRTGGPEYRRTGNLLIFPPIGAALSALPDPRAGVTDAALGAVTDDNYTWV
ncbi:hypothetical protein [Streptomyces sp. NPDC056144]|uniref:hypothetical protein n=1 Tax=unclassified Streptomyces TaxID=2593676 RepID=UPI0035D6497C